MTNCLIDTNILVYAYQVGHEKQPLAVQAINDLIDENTGVLSVQNLAEFSRVVTEKLPSKLSFEEARIMVSQLTESFSVLYYDEVNIQTAIEIKRQFGTMFFDSLIIATMKENGVDTIITEDESFKKIPWIKTINPFK